jgi:PST family polysaccharide transporter
VAAAYPRLAAIPRSARDEFGRTIGGALLALWLPLIPIAALTAWLAGWLVTLLFGAAFSEGAAALRILIWASIPYALDQTLAYALIARGRHFFAYWINGSGLLLNVALNLWLIPQLGFVGCAISTVISLSFVMLLVVGVSVVDRLPIRLPDLSATTVSLRRAVYD